MAPALNEFSVCSYRYPLSLPTLSSPFQRYGQYGQVSDVQVEEEQGGQGPRRGLEQSVPGEGEELYVSMGGW